MGRNGTGKTVGGVWQLSHSAFDVMPFVMINHKDDELIGSIPYVEEIGLNRPPKHPGLYMVRPHPSRDEENLENFLEKIWEREHTGVYVDEGYMINRNSPAMHAIFTQGRSKHIQRIMLTQRPVNISLAAFSEADYFAVFQLNYKKDRDRVAEYFPADMNETLKEHHFRWYDVKRNLLIPMTPVDDPDTILNRFEHRLKPRRRRLI